MNNKKLILLQEKSSYKLNIFTISEDSKLIPLFNNRKNRNLLHLDKVLPYFDGVELMLDNKCVIKEIQKESWDFKYKKL